ncbi:hypothetical protein [Acetobacter persici]|uniref:hypothetical protein n=1 Tax=Acetobacter persici TaxID=1076596 RepID=UPI000B719FDF|nr:hypothetical protein [Acetobacter persici]OUI91016.1 hypothetical protein HK19_08325 [Acetobacter persici]
MDKAAFNHFAGYLAEHDSQWQGSQIPGPFAYAERWDEKMNTYVGLAIERASNAIVVIDGDSVIVNPDIAEAHRAVSAQPESTDGSNEPRGIPLEAEGEPEGTQRPSSSEKKPTRFTGAVMISPERPARDIH